MCGISGYVTNVTVDDHAIAEQLRVLRHRGSDAEGHFGTGAGVIAQNRLAVIDLETGDPPVTNEDGTVGVALNGEIYNFQQLRTKLEARGHRFRTNGDTEVLAHLAEDLEGAEVATALDGMFAFAVWDAQRRTLLLGRDRLGKKPLYYFSSGSIFVFGSEIKAVLAHPAVPRELDEDALPAYLAFGYVPTPRTFFRGIVSVPPGHILTVHPTLQVTLARYGRVPRGNSPSPPISMQDAARGVRSRLETAVQRRLISDVPLGAFLSGGLDSSAIVALMATMSGTPVQTFTIGFDDSSGFDERQYANVVARRYHTDHHEFVVAPEAVDLIERLVWHHDQPFGDSSAIPTYLLNELTRSHVTVALSGDGGDELFAGYERFAAAVAVERYRRLPAYARRVLGRTVLAMPRRSLRGRIGSLQRFVSAADLGLPWAYLAWLSFLPKEMRQAALPSGSAWAEADFEAKWSSSEGGPVLERLLELNLETYLVDDLLVKADRMSMAHGLEVRSPFLDIELLSYARSLPPELKVRGFAGKRVLKAAVADLLPGEIRHRRKRGFGVPLDRWFREDLSTYLSSTLGSGRARVREHLEPQAIDRVLYEHARGQRDHGQALWLLLTLEVFLRREGW
jgi:asparagine synthase (glutamine-hydrolysing)